MKFMGLILMCAASCMALLLPALGVVKFPVLDESTLQSISASADQQAQAAAPTPPPNSDPQASPGLLVAAQLSAQDNQAGGQPPSPALAPNGKELLGKIPFTQVASQKVGLGVWLLLLPAMLVGLGMWTFGSSPKSSK